MEKRKKRSWVIIVISVQSYIPTIPFSADSAKSNNFNS